MVATLVMIPREKKEKGLWTPHSLYRECVGEKE